MRVASPRKTGQEPRRITTYPGPLPPQLNVVSNAMTLLKSGCVGRQTKIPRSLRSVQRTGVITSNSIFGERHYCFIFRYLRATSFRTFCIFHMTSGWSPEKPSPAMTHERFLRQLHQLNRATIAQSPVLAIVLRFLVATVYFDNCSIARMQHREKFSSFNFAMTTRPTSALRRGRDRWLCVSAAASRREN